MSKDDLWDKISNDVPPGKLTKEDIILKPLLDEINLIADDAIRSFVRAMLLFATTFWTASASVSGRYHPPDERTPQGAVLHTQRVVRIASFLALSQERDQLEIDILIAAALIHDITKVVEWADGNRSYDPYHPLTVDNLYEMVKKKDIETADESQSSTLSLDTDTLYRILRLVRCHLGRWSPIPELIPITILEMTLHWADYLAAHLHEITDKECVDERWLLSSKP